jgi:uncharacterized membrane protein YfcA
MSVQSLIIFIALALLSEILGTVGGFGSSMFFVPIASYFLDFHSVLGVTAVFHVSSNLTKIFFFRKGYDKKLLLTIGLPAIIFVIIGAYLSKSFDIRILEIVLAVFVMTVSLTLLIFRHFSLKPTLVNSIGGGVDFRIYSRAARHRWCYTWHYACRIQPQNGGIHRYFGHHRSGVDSCRTVVYALNGYIHPENLKLSIILLFVSIAGTYIGKKVLTLISEEQFKSIVLVLVFITGIITLGKVTLVFL